MMFVSRATRIMSPAAAMLALRLPRQFPARGITVPIRPRGEDRALLGEFSSARLGSSNGSLVLGCGATRCACAKTLSRRPRKSLILRPQVRDERLFATMLADEIEK
jgi:hypothetical protein